VRAPPPRRTSLPKRVPESHPRRSLGFVGRLGHVLDDQDRRLVGIVVVRGPDGRRSPPHKPRPPGPSLIRSRVERVPVVSVPRGRAKSPAVCAFGWHAVGREFVATDTRCYVRSGVRGVTDARPHGRRPLSPPTSSEVRLGRSPALCAVRQLSRGARPDPQQTDPAPDRTYETPERGASRSFGRVLNNQHWRPVGVVIANSDLRTVLWPKWIVSPDTHGLIGCKSMRQETRVLTTRGPS
jgi:hypothetical protein